MPILHVRDVSEELYDRIRQQAQLQNRSISGEVITLLQRALSDTERSQGEVLNSIRHRRFFRPTETGAPDSTTLLAEDRAR